MRHIARGLLDLDYNAATRSVDRSAQEILLAIGSAMLGRHQSVLTPPLQSSFTTVTTVPDDSNLAPRSISLALVRLRAASSGPEHAGYEAHLRGEAASAAALVRSLREACPEETVFVATPHRIQRHAVREALQMGSNPSVDATVAEDADPSVALAEGLEGLTVNERAKEQEAVIVDTVERLQG